MAIVLWTLAGSGPEHEAKVKTSQAGGATGEETEKKEAEEESSEERNEPSEAQSLDLEDKVCFVQFYVEINALLCKPDLKCT